MRLEHGRISSRQLFFAVFCFLQGTILRSSFVVTVLGHEAWMTAISSLVFCVPILLVYGTLLKWYPDKNLFEINEEVFGTVAGKIVSALYLFFFFSLSSLNINDMGTFVGDFLIPQTPLLAIHGFLIVFAIYCVRKGLEGLVRPIAMFSLVAVLVVVVNFILVVGDTEWSFLLPMFTHEPIEYVQGTHITATIPMGETLVFLMIAPATKEKERVTPALIGGVVASALFMLVVVIRDTVTLGPLLPYVTFPSFEAARSIGFSNFFARTETLYALVLVSLTFIKVCLLLYITSLGLAQITGLKRYLPLITVSGAFATAYSMIVFKSGMEHLFWGVTVTPFSWTVFEYILPLLTLVTALIRRKKASGQAGQKKEAPA